MMLFFLPYSVPFVLKCCDPLYDHMLMLTLTLCDAILPLTRFSLLCFCPNVSQKTHAIKGADAVLYPVSFCDFSSVFSRLWILTLSFPLSLFLNLTVSILLPQPFPLSLSDGLFCCLKHLIGGQVYIIRGESSPCSLAL